MPKEPPSLDFKTPEQLHQLLDYTSRRLHYINRVSGESNLMWHLAELIRATGRMTDLIDDADVSAEFGDGWTAGTLAEPAQTDRLLVLLRERLGR